VKEGRNDKDRHNNEQACNKTHRCRYLYGADLGRQGSENVKVFICGPLAPPFQPDSKMTRALKNFSNLSRAPIQETDLSSLCSCPCWWITGMVITDSITLTPAIPPEPGKNVHTQHATFRDDRSRS